MSKKYPEYLYVDNNFPDFCCPLCDSGLLWNENGYAFNKEYVKCGNCGYIFCIIKKIKETYNIIEV